MKIHGPGGSNIIETPTIGWFSISGLVTPTNGGLVVLVLVHIANWIHLRIQIDGNLGPNIINCVLEFSSLNMTEGRQHWSPLEGLSCPSC